MVIYVCPTCNKSFNRKCNFIDHTINKKKPCVPLNYILNEYKINDQNAFQNIPKKSEIFQNIPKNSVKTENLLNDVENTKKHDHSCNFCLKNFSSGFNLNKHLKNSCKVKRFEEEKKENIFNNLIEIEQLKETNKHLLQVTELLKKQNEDLNKKNDELNKKINLVLRKNNKIITNNNTNTNSNNTQNITNITITPLNAFGNENLKTIKHGEFVKIVTDMKNTGKHCINKLVDLIHFNPNLPENMNVYMSDFNRDKYMVFDGNDWVLNQNGELLAFEILEHIKKLYNINETKEFENKLENDANFEKFFNATFKKYFDYLFDEVDDIDLSPEELKKKNNFKLMIDNEIKNKLYNNRLNVISNYKKKYETENKLIDNK